MLGASVRQEISVSSRQFCCDIKLLKKMKSVKIKKKYVKERLIFSKAMIPLFYCSLNRVHGTFVLHTDNSE